jgi:hypothetical protein
VTARAAIQRGVLARVIEFPSGFRLRTDYGRAQVYLWNYGIKPQDVTNARF